MDASKWRISKACHECRARKIRCNGQQPCDRCKLRGLDCAYREKARNRPRKQRPVANLHQQQQPLPSEAPVPAVENRSSAVNTPNEAVSTPSNASVARNEGSIHNHSVAATHRASPTTLLELYYGPSSNFSLLQSIYNQIEGRRPNSPSREGVEGVEEVGPGLALFNHEKLYFGDLADTQRSVQRADDYSAVFLDVECGRKYLERYLATYWNGFPMIPKEEFRRKHAELFKPPMLFSFDSPDIIIMMLAMALGAYILGQDEVAEFLFQKSKQGAVKLDEVVNIQVVQIYLMMITVRKAIAAGLHKEACVRAGANAREIDRRRITFWSLYFWETWICFSLGRLSSIPDPGASVPVPPDQKLLQNFVTLSRIMSKCMNRIYHSRHDSLLPVWHAANEIRQELLDFAKSQIKDTNFGLVGDPSSGELGISQAMVSTMYHHTLLLTFRPFLILRGKMRLENATSGKASSEDSHQPPSWLDNACDYCLEAAKNMIGFLSGSCLENELCRSVKYHGFFIEGSCYVLAFDLLQDRVRGQRHLPWIHSGLRCLRSMVRGCEGKYQLSTTMESIEQMVRSVIPNFQPITGASQRPPPNVPQQGRQFSAAPSPSIRGSVSGEVEAPALVYPSMPFGLGVNSRFTGSVPAMSMPEEQIDFTAADVGWDIDFSTMDMEAFLSIDPSQSWGFRT